MYALLLDPDSNYISINLSPPFPPLHTYIYMYVCILLLLHDIVAKFLAYNIVLVPAVQHNYLTCIYCEMINKVNTYHLALQIFL